MSPSSGYVVMAEEIAPVYGVYSFTSRNTANPHSVLATEDKLFARKYVAGSNAPLDNRFNFLKHPVQLNSGQ